MSLSMRGCTFQLSKHGTRQQSTAVATNASAGRKRWLPHLSTSSMTVIRSGGVFHIPPIGGASRSTLADVCLLPTSKNRGRVAPVSPWGCCERSLVRVAWLPPEVLHVWISPTMVSICSSADCQLSDPTSRAARCIDSPEFHGDHI